MSDDITTKPVNLNEDDDFDPTLIDEEESEVFGSLTTGQYLMMCQMTRSGLYLV